jgi:hypothetical protein
MEPHTGIAKNALIAAGNALRPVHNNKQKSIVRVNEAGLLSIIRIELLRYFKDISVLSLVNRVDWTGAMPIANEDYVKLIRTEQGQNHLYHGGDFMGCPAMETALMNGKRAAEQLIMDKRHG